MFFSGLNLMKYKLSFGLNQSDFYKIIDYIYALAKDYCMIEMNL